MNNIMRSRRGGHAPRRPAASALSVTNVPFTVAPELQRLDWEQDEQSAWDLAKSTLPFDPPAGYAPGLLLPLPSRDRFSVLDDGMGRLTLVDRNRPFSLSAAFEPAGDGHDHVSPLPVAVLHAILRRLRGHDALHFALTSKAVLRAALKRGGLPSSHPRLCLVHRTRQGRLEPLRKMIDIVGPNAFTTEFRGQLLVELLSHVFTSPDVDAMTALLLEPNNSPPPLEALHWACRRGRVPLVQRLVDAGASPLARVDGMCALDVALDAGHLDLFALLVKENPAYELPVRRVEEFVGALAAQGCPSNLGERIVRAHCLALTAAVQEWQLYKRHGSVTIEQVDALVAEKTSTRAQVVATLLASLEGGGTHTDY